MRSFLASSLLAFALLLPTTATASAQNSGTGLAVSLGLFDIFDDHKALEIGLEYRFRTFQLWGLDFEPVVGGSTTGDGNIWGYAGLRHDLRLSNRWVATPQFAVGLYEDGEGRDLGGPVEFRSGLEISYQLRRGGRVGLLFYHLSNARLFELNPGSESLVLTWSPGS